MFFPCMFCGTIHYKHYLVSNFQIKMWFEILPSAGIIFVAMAFPHASAYVLNNLVVGNMYRRQLLTREERIGYLRDRRLAGGDPYKVVDLV
ncbi:unnamed protein product [Acanthoscelides obtectus]|uniref:NADH dehydrogenase [ubiquinone] 1 alpha subcomplex subunit 1 n=1 Tax=Acanthoscelides obtectus TaxID=200917 RepID=A0A9P0KS97_ACAOB|nr:unnamed protein product [Acanthoscelides obtectus]CAK1655932.1 hypothetical protein AOBTE_LOCUS19447 [Acanthoscelides obtectus]